MTTLRFISILAALSVWAWLVSRRPRAGAGARRFGLVETGAGLAVSALLWWAYMKATNPGLALSLILQSHVDAGGGVVTTPMYLWFMALALGTGALFAFAGYFICARTGAFNIVNFAFRDAGLFFFIGMAAYLTLFTTASMVTGRARASWLLMLGLFAATAVYGIWTERVGPRMVKWIRDHGPQVLAMSPILIAILCLLQYVVTKRGGPMYEEFARYIVANDYIPLINRHFGQSMLASALMFVTGTGPDTTTFPRAAVNVWLYVTQIGFMFFIYRMLRELGTSRAGTVFGLIYLMLGNAALSLLPRILYDHDYPLIMNIYPDALFGLAGFAIMVWHLMTWQRDDTAAATPWWPALVVPAMFVMAFNYTAELNMAMALAVIAMLCVLAPFGRRLGVRLPLVPLLVLLLVCAAAAVAGAIQGGVLASRFATEEGRKSPFFEADASSATMSIAHARWWYLPEVLPGFQTGFGNMALPEFYLADPKASPGEQAAWMQNQSMNQPLMEKFFADTSGRKFRYIYPIYLAEMRLFQTLRLVWFPFAGLAALGLLLGVAPRFARRMFAAGDAQFAQLRLFWLLGAASFTAGLLIVFFTNAIRGNALFWKWALTRAFEPGLLLGMLTFAIVLDGFLRFPEAKGWRYPVWVGLALVMSFGTLFRIIYYPSFNG